MSRAVVTQSISSLGLCLFAALILFTSLISSNRAAAGSHNRLSTLNFYWGKHVLPDNPFYNVLMIRDRVRLMGAAPHEANRIRLQYAERRYRSAQELAAAGKLDLAISTLSKSQTYVVEAARGVTARQLSAHEADQLIQSLDHSLYRLQLFKEQYPGAETPLLTSLRLETEMLLDQLQSSPPVAAN